MSALRHFDREMLTIGLRRSRVKSQIFSFTPIEEDEDLEDCADHGLTVVPSHEGIIVCGSPVGSESFSSKYILSKVTGHIHGEIQKLRSVIAERNGLVQQDLQAVYQVVRLCIPAELIFYLRTCSPVVTNDAALKLDSIVESFVIELLNAGQFMRDLSDEEKGNVMARLHLKISKGGLGIISAELANVPAYLGSLALSLNAAQNLMPQDQRQVVYDMLMRDDNFEGSSDEGDVGNLNTTLAVLKRLVVSTKEDFGGVEAIDELTVEAMWDQQFERIQHVLYSLCQNRLEKNLDLELPQGVVLSGPTVGVAQQNQDIKEIVIQHRANKDKICSAFLTANPGDYLCKMSNAAFQIAVQKRLLLRINGSKKYCLCAQSVGTHLHHAFKCGNMVVRNQVRNTLHKEFKDKLVEILKNQINLTSLPLRIPLAEPMLEDFYDLKPRSAISNDMKLRADIEVQNFAEQRSHIIDVTFTESTIRLYPNGYNVPGDAAKHGEVEKLKQYLHWDLQNSEHKFWVFNVETFGVLGATAKELLKSFISDNGVNRYE